MRLDNEIKLDYKDVLLKPKRSTLSSRRDVEMTRSFTFKNSGETLVLGSSVLLISGFINVG